VRDARRMARAMQEVADELGLPFDAVYERFRAIPGIAEAQGLPLEDA
jgi:hypothetical protein